LYEESANEVDDIEKVVNRSVSPRSKFINPSLEFVNFYLK
jgi:hypothetical protein